MHSELIRIQIGVDAACQCGCIRIRLPFALCQHEASAIGDAVALCDLISRVLLDKEGQPRQW